MFRRLCLRHVYLIHVTVVLAVLTNLFAQGLIIRTAANTRVKTVLPFASCPASCVQNFDSVAPPTLPTGWTATIPTALPGDLAWRTVNTASDSAPNSAFANDPDHVTNNLLTSRTFSIVSSAVMTFSRRNTLEAGFDGMVLEISSDGGGFFDIMNSGGSFVSGGYNGPIDTRYGNPLAGRPAWTGDSGGFVTTQVNLPSAVIGRTVAFRWRVATDESVGGVGAFIDNITLTGWFEPPNDNFVNPQTILGASGSINGSNVGATKEANEPNHAGNTGGSSVWYRWQAPDSGRFVFTTYHSNFETLLAVYTGDNLPGTLVASNDLDPNQDGSIFSQCGPRTSRVSFNAVGGVVYRIAVDRRSISASGTIVLRWGRSASISGGIRDVSGRQVRVDTVRLVGDACRNTQSSGTIDFTDVPTGGSYDIEVTLSGALFNRYGTSDRISPLTGNVSNFSYYQSTPAYSISGTVTIPGGDLTGLTVMCVSTPGGLISRAATVSTPSNYSCAGLPVFGDYVITPSKAGFRFSPTSRTELRLTQNISGINFTATLAPTYTISGRVTNSTGGVSGVAIALSGSQTASRLTDLNGNYSFTGVTEGGNYTITPSYTDYTFAPLSQSFNNLTANQTANFTATPLLQLILDLTGQVVAVDSMLLVRDPFPIINNANLLNRGVDRNTRVTIFVANLQLGPGGVPSSVVINLIGSNNQTYNIPAEDVRPVSNLGFAQVIFRLPDTLTAGTCTLVVNAQGTSTNIGAMRIR